MDNALFKEDQAKIKSAVIDYPLGSHQIGEIAKLSGYLYMYGVSVESLLRAECERRGIEIK